MDLQSNFLHDYEHEYLLPQTRAIYQRFQAAPIRFAEHGRMILTAARSVSTLKKARGLGWPTGKWIHGHGLRFASLRFFESRQRLRPTLWNVCASKPAMEKWTL